MILSSPSRKIGVSRAMVLPASRGGTAGTTKGVTNNSSGQTGNRRRAHRYRVFMNVECYLQTVRSAPGGSPFVSSQRFRDSIGSPFSSCPRHARSFAAAGHAAGSDGQTPVPSPDRIV
jgi:hypothetical protein